MMVADLTIEIVLGHTANKKADQYVSFFICGEGGIRTLGTV